MSHQVRDTTLDFSPTTGNEAAAISNKKPLPPFQFIERVLNGHIVLRIDEFKYSGRIHIPDNAKRSHTKGIVVALADDITDIKIGDKILYSQFAGYLLKFEDTPLARCISYSEVLLILRGDAPVLESES